MKQSWEGSHDGASNCRFKSAGRPLAAVADRHRLHGDDREPPVRLDAVRGADRAEARLGPCFHPGRLHHLRAHRDMAGADRRLVRRPLRSQDRRGDRRRAGRHLVDAERLCQHARHALHLGRDRRHRRRRRLRHLRRQRAEMVSRQARPGGRPDRCRFRRRLGAHHHPDPGHDPQFRLRGDLLLVRSRPGPGGLRPGLVASRPAAWPGAGLGARAAIDAELHARRDAAHPDLLGDVPDVRAGRRPAA